MKNASEMEVLVMALKHRPDRYWYMLGVLDAMNFPFDKCHTVMGKYWRDYESLGGMLDAMIEDRFPWADRLRHKIDDDVERGFRANLWSACRCLRWVATQDHPFLVMEDDLLLGVDYPDLINRLKTLPKDAEIAVLGRSPEGFEVYNDYWGEGWGVSSGGICNVYTPSGAQRALEVAEWYGVTWENIGKYYPNETTYCVNGEPLFSYDGTLDPLTSLSTDGWYRVKTEFKGYGHHSLYDKWVDGLNVEQ